VQLDFQLPIRFDLKYKPDVTGQQPSDKAEPVKEVKEGASTDQQMAQTQEESK
jgi:hypothetical protein